MGKHSDLNRELTVPHTVVLPIELHFPYVYIVVYKTYNIDIYVYILILYNLNKVKKKKDKFKYRITRFNYLTLKHESMIYIFVLTFLCIQIL